MLAAALLAAIISVAEVPNPRASGGWITDLADLIPAEQEARLNQQLDELHAATQAEFALVTVEDVAETPKEFATALFARLSVGDDQRDDGLLILLVRDKRRLEIETGYGLEPILPDAWLGQMQREVMTPRFKAGDFAGGLVAGIDRIGAQLRTQAPPVAPAAPREESPLGIVYLLLAIAGAGTCALVWHLLRKAAEANQPTDGELGRLPLPSEEPDPNRAFFADTAHLLGKADRKRAKQLATLSARLHHAVRDGRMTTTTYDEQILVLKELFNQLGTPEDDSPRWRSRKQDVEASIPSRFVTHSHLSPHVYTRKSTGVVAAPSTSFTSHHSSSVGSYESSAPSSSYDSGSSSSYDSGSSSYDSGSSYSGGDSGGGGAGSDW